ncbi:MAG TPA: GntR family transcriptional regulator, partial [Chloroflexota bacterium]|nr:GntR family transcriptional regulator [Chloroflexota bacterium]
MAQSKVAERICDELREMIMDGRLAGGMRVTETMLATRLKVSRTPIREALVQLHIEGLVVRLPHSATIVRQLDEGEVEDAFQLRALLEGYGATRAAEYLTGAQIDELERLCDDMEAHHSHGPGALAHILERNDRFHQIIAEASGNRRLAAALRATMEIPRVYRSYYWYSDRERQRSFLYHREIIEAFRSRDPLWA